MQDNSNYKSLSVEECKKHIGDLGLTDKQIEDQVSNLKAFIEAALDFAFIPDTVIKENYNVKKENIESKNWTNKSDYLLPSIIRTPSA